MCIEGMGASGAGSYPSWVGTHPPPSPDMGGRHSTGMLACKFIFDFTCRKFKMASKENKKEKCITLPKHLVDKCNGFSLDFGEFIVILSSR